jgi:hypothetical protein
MRLRLRTEMFCNSKTEVLLLEYFQIKCISEIILAVVFYPKLICYHSLNRDSFDSLVSTGAQGCYCGFDPTASSLHIGNLIALIALIHCQRKGHMPVALIGSATALVG